MKTRLSKWGNSLAVRLPKSLLKTAGLREGQDLDVSSQDGKLELRAVATAPRYTHEWMIAEMKRLGPENEPPTLEWGPDVGSEVLPDDDWSDLEAICPPLAKPDDGRR